MATTEAIASSVTYRHLPEEEWNRLRHIYESHGDVLPSSESASAFVAEVDGKIIGMVGINLVAHIGPLFVEQEHREQGIATELVNQAKSFLKENGAHGCVMFPSNARSEKVAMKAGLRDMNCKLFGKEF